jgi:hypothetical protein
VLVCGQSVGGRGTGWWATEGRGVAVAVAFRAGVRPGSVRRERKTSSLPGTEGGGPFPPGHEGRGREREKSLRKATASPCSVACAMPVCLNDYACGGVPKYACVGLSSHTDSFYLGSLWRLGPRVSAVCVHTVTNKSLSTNTATYYTRSSAYIRTAVTHSKEKKTFTKASNRPSAYIRTYLRTHTGAACSYLTQCCRI